MACNPHIWASPGEPRPGTESSETTPGAARYEEDQEYREQTVNQQPQGGLKAIADTVLVWVGDSKFGTVWEIIAGETIVNAENCLQLRIATVTIPPVRLVLMMTAINN